MSLNPNVNWTIVENNPHLPWDYTLLSANKMSKHPFFNKILQILK